MIWLLAQILLPPLIQLRKQLDNSRLASRSGMSYADCTYSSSRVKVAFSECRHSAESTPSSLALAFTTESLHRRRGISIRSDTFELDLLELLIAVSQKLDEAAD
jgi:hypothetical protein